MSAPFPCRQTIAAALLATVLAPVAQSAETWDDFTRNPERIMPNPGMLLEDLQFFYGEPSIKHVDLGLSDTQVWDYGTFRTFVSDGIVQRSKLW